MFIWRCAKGVIPILAELPKRIRNCDPICRRCRGCEETVEHALWDYEWSNSYCQASPLQLRMNAQNRSESILQWIERTMKINDDDMHAYFVTLMWVLWKSQNIIVYEGKQRSHVECFGIAARLMIEHKC